MPWKLVAGNWKMNGSKSQTIALTQAIQRDLKTPNRVEVVLCPPFVYLSDAFSLLKDSDIALGGQDTCDEAEGAYTGEVSAGMLHDVGCRYVIVGHSERRNLYGESDALVARKYAQAIRVGLKPIFCLGESLEERETGDTEKVVKRQLEALLAQVGVEGLGQGAIAYEPIWAIGTGKTATPSQAQEVHAFLRQSITAYSTDMAKQIQIVYGGSVNPENARALFQEADIDGGLIGGASLKAEQFAAICQAAE